MSTVGEEMKTHLPGMTPAMKQGSEGPVMSDLQFMQNNERKQHEQNYIYEHGHNDGSDFLVSDRSRVGRSCL